MASPAPALIDTAGAPLRPRADGAFTASSRTLPEVANWNPRLSSPDAALLPERETISARIHDLVRNDGWAASGVQRNLDSVIGAQFRLSHRPDWRALGISAEDAAAVSRAVEAKWREYSEDPDAFCDAARHCDMIGLFGQAYRHELLDGEALALPLWMPARGGKWATAFQIIDPARLSNPNDAPDRDDLRGGVETDRYGAADAYHIRAGHPGDWWGLLGGDRWRWERVPRFTPEGRRRVIHYFDREGAGQTRGVSRLTPIVKKLRMLGRYDEVELQAAVANAVLAAFIESPYDHEQLIEAVQSGSLDPYQNARADYYNDPARRQVLAASGMQITSVFPGEEVRFPAAARPNTAFAGFQSASLRNIAGAFDLSYEQFAGDWSQVNYSSARAALLEVWRGLSARRARFGKGFAGQTFALWFEEEFERGELPIPSGAPGFYEARTAWLRHRWLGPGRGWVDPTKEAQGSQMRMDAMLSTLEQECAEQGLDYEEVLEQRKIEYDLLKSLGLPEPQWLMVLPTSGDSTVDDEEEKKSGSNKP